MSHENVNVVRGMFERWERGDYATPEFFDVSVEFVRIGAEGTGASGTWRGVSEAWAATVEYLQAWEDLRSHAERFVDLGDRVLVLERQTGHGRRSGVPLDHEIGQLFTLRDCKIVRWESYWDRAEALEAVGLRE